jgi:S-adenosylmethionine:tRNA ribosyltransferase-isomerase
MDLADFDFELPPELIAQEPAAIRGASRLLTLERATGRIADREFRELPSLLQPGDLLVVNDTQVFAARLLGVRRPGGGAAECLLVRRIDEPEVQDNAAAATGADEIWEALVHPGQRLKEGSQMEFSGGGYVIRAEVLARRFHGRRAIRLRTESGALAAAIDAIGHVPLPPYIKRGDRPEDRDRYQTIFARARGSIAAPTAGLHFTPEILAALDERGVERTTITLHVGYGTFQPIRVDDVDQHRMEAEFFEVPAGAADALTRALRNRRRIVAVGTTTTRTLESLECDGRRVLPTRGSTDLFIRPGHRFRLVSGLMTNFHLPRSSLLLLVSAFAGRERVLPAYRHAIAERYRFYSYGDAMFVF